LADWIRIRALTLINALINGTEDLEERFALRNEFLAMNMASALKVGPPSRLVALLVCGSPFARAYLARRRRD
jgi:hypothetical protein